MLHLHVLATFSLSFTIYHIKIIVQKGVDLNFFRTKANELNDGDGNGEFWIFDSIIDFLFDVRKLESNVYKKQGAKNESLEWLMIEWEFEWFYIYESFFCVIKHYPNL